MNDKMTILKMLEDGKITAEEACKLIEALQQSNGKETEKEKEPIIDEEFAKKMENTAKEMVGATKKLTEKIFGQISSTISNVENRFTLIDKKTFPIEESVEGYDFVVKTAGLGINIIPCFSNHIIMDIECKSLQKNIKAEDCIKFNFSNGIAELNINFPDNTWGKLDLQIPRNLKKVTVETQNAKCCINDLICDIVKATSSNAKIDLNHCKVGNVLLGTDNAKIVISNSKIESGILKTNNGRIELIDTKINNIDADTCNAPIYLNDVTIKDAVIGSYILNTSNAKIDFIVGNFEQCAYAVDAYTSVGTIAVKLEDMIYNEGKVPNTASKVSGQSSNYEEAPVKLLINARTSNAAIQITK